MEKKLLSQNNISSVLVLYYFLCLVSYSKSFDNPFKQISKLPSGDFFIIMQNGIYIYNYDFSIKRYLYSFEESQKITSDSDNNNTIISELKQDDKFFLISLIKRNIYIYDYENNNLYHSPYNLTELFSQNNYCQEGVIYNLIPYDFKNNNFNFIITFLVTSTVNNMITFLYYTIDISNNSINCNKKIDFYDKAVILGTLYFSDISPYEVSCQISSSPTKMNCFYSRKNRKVFRMINFQIENEPQQNDIINIKENNKAICKIKSSISTDKTLLFGCYLLSNNSVQCYYNNKANNVLTDISYSHLSNCNDIKTYYFNELNEFVMICKNQNNFQIQRYNFKNTNNTNNYINYYFLSKLEIKYCNSLDMYSLIYNNSINEYNIICDYNFTTGTNDCLINEISNDLLYKDPEFEFGVLTEHITNIKDEYFDTSTEHITNKKDEYFDNSTEQITNKIVEYIDNSTDKMDDIINNLINNIHNFTINALNNTLINESNNNNLNHNLVLNSEDIYEFYHDCSEQYPYLLIENNKCIQNCYPIDFFSKICKIQNNIPIVVDSMINNIKKAILNGSMDPILLYNFTSIILSQNNIIFSLFAENEQNINSNISLIKLNECGNILRDIYKIDDNIQLILFKLDIFKEGLLIPFVEYEVYDVKNKRKLDLKYCNNTNIDILLPVSINENTLFKYNISSEYYNDLCFPYTTENSTEIIIKDRRDEYIKQNLSLCEKNCEYRGYDKDKKRAICNCNIKQEMNLFSEIKNDKDKLL